MCRTRFRDIVYRVGTHCVDSTYVIYNQKCTKKAQVHREEPSISRFLKIAQQTPRYPQTFLCAGIPPSISLSLTRHPTRPRMLQKLHIPLLFFRFIVSKTAVHKSWKVLFHSQPSLGNPSQMCLLLKIPRIASMHFHSSHVSGKVWAVDGGAELRVWGTLQTAWNAKVKMCGTTSDLDPNCQ